MRDKAAWLEERLRRRYPLDSTYFPIDLAQFVVNELDRLGSDDFDVDAEGYPS